MTSPAAVVAAACTGLACVLTFAPPRRGLAGPRGSRSSWTVPRWLLLAGPTGVLVLPLWMHGRQLVLGVIGLLAVAAGTHLVARTRRALAAERRSERLLTACRALAGDLRAGEPAPRALDLAARDWSELAPVSRAAELGADVPAALRVVAQQPGADQLAIVAAAWQVAQQSGGRLAPAVGRAADSIAEERALRRRLSSELAAAHATARLLAALPLLMILMGRGIGGDPVGFLTGSVAGIGCLAAGLLLSFLGLLWLDRIASGVLR